MPGRVNGGKERSVVLAATVETTSARRPPRLSDRPSGPRAQQPGNGVEPVLGAPPARPAGPDPADPAGAAGPEGGRGGERTRGNAARRLGPRALATRRRLLDATAELLATGTILDIKVVEVARAIGTSPATFYQYFPTVEDALLTLSDEANARMSPLVDLLRQPWDVPETLDLARQFSAGFLEHFDRNRAVLRARNLAAQEGDSRFRESRDRAMLPVTYALEAKVREAQAVGRVDPALNAFAVAGALATMMQRTATFGPNYNSRGVSRDDLVETMARLIHHTVTGFHY